VGATIITSCPIFLYSAVNVSIEVTTPFTLGLYVSAAISMRIKVDLLFFGVWGLGYRVW
jgi:hypothetical protein